MMALTSNPKLDQPGAGLPKPELMIARIVFARFRKGNSQEAVGQFFDRERSTILELARDCDAEIGRQPVLIKRLRGMEDSSRFWSVNMTVHHLQIVNTGIAQAMTLLGRGKLPPGQINTAEVKPDPSIGRDVIDAFDASCDTIQQAVAAIPDLHTSVRYPHPWFGPLDVGGWYAMAAFHMRLHRKQIVTILAQMVTE